MYLQSGGLCLNKNESCSSAVVRFKEITDGTTHTILIGESTGRGAEEELRCSEDNKHKTDEFSGAWASYKNISRIKLDPNNSVCGQSVSAINPPAKFQFVEEEFFSDHPGGVETLRCDGSVQFMQDNTERDVYFALCTRNGEEPIPE